MRRSAVTLALTAACGSDDGSAGDVTSETEDMPGMMSDRQMKELADVKDVELQQMWLQMTIDHHKGAIEMAQEEQDDGRYRDAVELADGIEAAQKREIATMEDLLD